MGDVPIRPEPEPEPTIGDRIAPAREAADRTVRQIVTGNPVGYLRRKGLFLVAFVGLAIGVPILSYIALVLLLATDNEL